MANAYPSVRAVLPSSSFHRKVGKCLFKHSRHCWKVNEHLKDVCPQRQCNPQISPVFLGSESRCYALQYFSRSTLRLRSACNEDCFSSDVSTLENVKRSSTSPDNSSIYMGNMNDFERQLQEFYMEIKTMLKMGNTDEAIDLLQANYVAVKEQIDAGSRGMEQAAVLDIIALAYTCINDFKFAEHLLEMLNEIVGALENDEAYLDSVLVHIGSMYSSLGKFAEALAAYGRSLEILEDQFGKKSAFLITPLLGMAKAFGFIGRATKASEIYHRAINILEMSRGTESVDLIIPLFGLGNLFLKEGKAADAETSFNRILNIYTKLYGGNDGRVGIATWSLAHAICAKGDLNEAIRLYRKGLHVIKDSKYMSLDDDILQKMKIDLAELLHVAGRGHEGRELLEECLLIAEGYSCNGHPGSVTHLVNLATSYSRSKNFVEAERLLRMSLQILSSAVGPNDPSITFPMLDLATTLYHLGQDEEAEKLAQEALAIRENAFGDQSLPVGEALDCLVSIKKRLGKDEEVLPLLWRVLSIQEKEFGYESEGVIVTLKKLVFYLGKMGERDQSLPLQKRLAKLRTKYKETVFT